MRLCRFERDGTAHVGFFDERGIIPIEAAAAQAPPSMLGGARLLASDDLLAYLPPDGPNATLARTLDEGAGLAVAAVNRELRANLVELARLEVPSDDDDFGDALSTPVRDAKES